MNRLFALTLCTLLLTTCCIRHGNATTKGSTMRFSVSTQDQLDQANQRIHAFKDELLRDGFREVSVSTSNIKEEFILEGNYGKLKSLRVTLRANKVLEDEEPEFSGGIDAYVRDEAADRDYESLYKRVATAVTGKPQ